LIGLWRDRVPVCEIVHHQEEAFMRLSVRADDPGYLPYACMGRLGSKVRIMLDGQEVRYVITADTDEGLIRRFKHDSNNDLMVEDDHILEETIRGKVEIIMPPEYSGSQSS
jgi:hypothetical protein